MITQNNNPYYDDYNEEKGFHQILFKPGYAVQARELTQIQSILQMQIERFGKHIFKEGSIVLGGLFNVETNVDSVKIASTSTLTAEQLKQYIGTTLTGTTGNAAIVIDVADKSTWGSTNHVLMVRYIASGDSSDKFGATETLTCSNTLLANIVTATTDPIGKGSLFSIEDGVVFSRGYFVAFPKQRVVLDPLSQNPTCKVGFDSIPYIVTSVEDETLLDNAQGSYNYAAPGADRLVLIPSLKRYSINETLTLPDFVSLFSIENGNLLEVKDRSEYARLYDEIAKRTFDESGDYVVRGLGVLVREHLDTGTNEGYLTIDNGGDVNKLAIGIEPGLAYVKGYEVNNLSTKYIAVDKSTEFDFINSEVVSARSGTYILVNEMLGTIPSDIGASVNFYDEAGLRVTNKVNVATAASGNLIGSAKVKNLVLDSDGVYRIYLFDINMNSGYTVSDIKAVQYTNFFADTILEGGKTVLKETTVDSALIFPVGANHVRSIKGESDISDTTFSFRRTFASNSVAIGGTFTVTVPTSSETHSYGSTGLLSSVEKSTIIVTTNSNVTISMAGTCTGTIGTKSITGSGTFFTRLNPGDKVQFGGSGNYYIIDAISSNTAMTLKENLATGVSGLSYAKIYLQGDVIDLTKKGSDAGEIRTVSVTNDTTLAFDLKEAVTGLNVAVTFNLTRNTAVEIAKQRRSRRFVKIDCSSLGSLVDPINLGFSDVFQIRQIRKNSSAFTNATEGTNVTHLFRFNNGQKDNMYDHASITPIGAVVGASDHLLVELDYFLPNFSQGVGYFSVDSYDIDDSAESDTTIFTHQIPVYKSTFNGKEYNLRDYLDFRPVKVNTATDATTVGAASINPATSDTFNSEVNGLRIPTPSSQIFIDYTYYLARRDVIVVDKDGVYQAIKGVSALYPVTPQISEQVMGIANVYIPPYPSLSTVYARILGKQQEGVSFRPIINTRYTMRDIGVIKNRVDNLEYYSALSLLEKTALDMRITDENGLDRFKNGLFIDNFVNHSLGDPQNIDYKIAVDSFEQSIRPFFNVDSFMLEYTTLTNVQKTGNLLTLPYTEEVMIEQPRVTTTRNVEQSVYRFVGETFAKPEADTWIDTNTVNKTFDLNPGPAPADIINTNWNSWQTTSTGVSRTWSSTTTRTNQVRTGTQTVTTFEEQLQQLGNFVTDVSVQTYIRPQSIQLYSLGLKANTRYYVFFDGEDVTEYCTPGTFINRVVVPGMSPLNDNDVVANGSEGDAIKANSDGEFICILRLPESGKRFRTGTKEIVITDNPTNSVDATSFAKTFWVSNGIAVQKQNTVISVDVPVTTTRAITDTRQLVSTVRRSSGGDCIAYSFKIEAPEEEIGVFVSSVDIFVQAKDPKLGIWFEIREMTEDGGIGQTQVPFSKVWYTSAQITTTDDATTPHNVKFPSPVFLLNNTQYAFVAHTEGPNPNYYFWISRIGETDIITNTQVNDRSFNGNVFGSNNNMNWVLIPDIDFKIKINRANFTSLSGTATFKNSGYEFFEVQEPATDYVLIGENILGSAVFTLNNINVSRSIEVGDKIVSGAKTANVVEISGTKYYTDYLGTPFVIAEALTITDSTDASLGTANVGALEYGKATLTKFDNNNEYMYLKDSNGMFCEGCKIVGETSGIETTLTSFRSFPYSTINFKPNHLELIGANCRYTAKGILSDTGLYGANKDLLADENTLFTDEYVIRSKSDEVLNYAGDHSFEVIGTLTSETSYVSPVIDLRRINGVFVNNIINNDVTGEDGTVGGNLLNKYISQIVTLDEGQDAEDLVAYLTAYIPQGSDVKVWMKIRNGEDGTIFENRNWVELEKDKIGVFSSSADTDDFIELKYSVPEALLTGPFGEVQYTSNSATYTGFKQFAVKVGLLGTNSAMVPRVGDLRVIALQK